MRDTRETLQRGVGDFSPRPNGYERVLRRRDRKCRNQRIMARAVAAAIVVTGAVAFFRAWGLEPQPVNEGPPLDVVAPILGAGSEELASGTYRFDLDALASSGERFPTIAVTVPDGWANIDGWGINSGMDHEHWLGVTFWEVDEVFAQPCQWSPKMFHTGHSVADLAEGLAKQPGRDATEPTDIVVGGYHGLQMEWSVPVDLDVSACGDGFFDSWTSRRGSWTGDRYQQGPGQVDRLWILNVDGERLVIDGMYMPSTTPKDRAELWHVMDSIRFET